MKLLHLLVGIFMLVIGGAILALAGSATLTIKDGNTPPQVQTLGQTTDGSGNLYGNTVLVDGTAAANKAAVTSSNALKVDGSAVTQPVSGTITTTPPSNASTNVAQFGGTNVVTGTGASGSGIPRVTVSNDSTVILGAGAATIGALTANQSVNAAQIAGSAWATAATGIPKVGLNDGSGNSVTSTSNALDINLKTSAATVNTGTHTLTSSLYAPGTNGFTTTPFNVMTTEMNTLGIGAAAISSVGGTSGKFNQTNTGNAVFGRCWFTTGGTVSPTAGANISIWFLTSTDGGTTFEQATSGATPVSPPRAPDIVIPSPSGASALTGVILSPPRQNFWVETVKMFVLNNLGVAMAASGNVLTCGPEAIQY
jgi:hypothetical protein